MKKNQPLVSVIVNCFNGEKYLTKCLDSIKNQMKEMAKKTICSSSITSSFINLGGKIHYNYIFQNGEHYLLKQINNC